MHSELIFFTVRFTRRALSIEILTSSSSSSSKRQERDAGGKGPEPEPNSNEFHDEQPDNTGGGETQEAVVGVQTGRGTEDPVATDGVWHFRGISSLSSVDDYAC
jgi:hypothetical protein